MIIVRHIRQKRSSMEWKHASIPRPKKPRPSLKTQKILTTIFWDVQGILLVNWLEPGRTINSDRLCEISRTLRRRIQQRAHLRHVCARHVCVCFHSGQMGRARASAAQELALTSRRTHYTRGVGLQCVATPSVFARLGPSHYTLFDKIKDAVRGQHVQSSAKFYAIVRRWCTITPTEWLTKALRDVPAK